MYKNRNKLSKSRESREWMCCICLFFCLYNIPCETVTYKIITLHAIHYFCTTDVCIEIAVKSIDWIALGNSHNHLVCTSWWFTDKKGIKSPTPNFFGNLIQVINYLIFENFFYFSFQLKISGIFISHIVVDA